MLRIEKEIAKTLREKLDIIWSAIKERPLAMRNEIVTATLNDVSEGFSIITSADYVDPEFLDYLINFLEFLQNNLQQFPTVYAEYLSQFTDMKNPANPWNE